ncbi:MAG: ribonuclease H-like domain-containing protein [Spirochaetales bacterium]|nr:ribonuclease H-like domain-containing protein [Spirochaetales bacterium]
MDKLSSRLAALRKNKTFHSGGSADPSAAGDNILRDTSPGPDWIPVAPYVFRRSINTEYTPPNRLNPILCDSTSDIHKLVFFDLETTGLSGGAGTAIFLAGFGRISGKTLSVDQFFLSDFPGQQDFLGTCLSELDKDTVLVSYNGKSFDMPLFRTKCLMNGLSCNEIEHIDLLHISRRLWKRLIGSCALGDLEQMILDIQRTRDIPGSLIPERYFNYLRTAEPSLLSDIFEHHRQDICTLAVLLRTIQKILSGSDNPDHDRYELARILLPCEPERSLPLFTALADHGHGPSAVQAALYYKRAGDLAHESEYWRKAFALDTGFFTVVEYAKCLEHRKKEYNSAIQIINSFLEQHTSLPINLQNMLHHRLGRLIQKSE